jgi:hypothetical protein
MTSRQISNHLIFFTLVFTLCIGAIWTPVQAAPSAATSPVEYLVFKFYLDPALVPDMGFAKMVLPKYVLDMNAILAKNTNKQFVFDPETGIILTSVRPQTGSAPSPLPTAGFEIWAYAKPATNSLSWGGYASLDVSGAGVLSDLNWTRLYDPDNLAAADVLDYTLQINNMLHEFAHVFGAGIGEYYNLAAIKDLTGVSPLMDINLYNSGDLFWSDKPDFMSDPLLRLTRADSRSSYLAAVRYSNLTAAIISGQYRNGIPSFTQFTVTVLDQNGQPIPQADVKVWSVTYLSASTLLFDGMTDVNGQITLNWGGTSNPHNANNFLRLIKVYKDGVSLMSPKYISIYDADIALLVNHSSSYVITMNVAPVQPVSYVADFTSLGGQDGWVLESRSKSNLGGSLNATNITFNLGDDQYNRQYRSILSFDTSALPDNAVISSITLKIKKQGLVGANPFTSHGNILVDIRKSFFGTLAALQINDFQSASSLNKAASLLNAPTSDGWYSTSFSASAFSFVNLTGVTQLRLEFEKIDSNNRADFLKFFSGNADAASRPVLEIQYTVP